MIPPGGQTVVKAHGTKRFVPALTAASMRLSWLSWSVGPMALIIVL